MTDPHGISRRRFVASAGAAAVSGLFGGSARAVPAQRGRRRYAIVGTGVRGIGMWGRPLAERYADALEFVGLCDVNPLRLAYAKRAIGVDCPTFTSLEGMLETARPELLMVTTVDATHESCINGTEGRLEVRDHERQPWPVSEENETEMYVIENFGERKRVEIPKVEGGHGGGDDVLRDLIFRGTELPDYMRLPGSRAGAMSCLTGIAARKSMDEGRAVAIADLVRL